MSLLSTRTRFVFVLTALAAAAAAQTTVVVPCNLDNTLYENNLGNVSNGKGAGIFAGLNGTGLKRRAVLRFDVAAAVPAGAHVLAATLTVNVAQSTAALPIPVTVHRVLQPWGEGTSNATAGGGGGGTTATTNDATWLHNYYPGSFWSAAGGDFVATPSFTMSTPPLGIGTSPIAPGTVADAQFWLDNPAQNYGWLMKTDELLASTARRIDSRESTGVPPTLTVTYMTPGQLGTWGTGCPTAGGNFDVAFSGAPTGGTTIQIVQTYAPPSTIGANYFALDLDPIGAPLLPGCTVHLPLTQIIPGNIFVTNGVGYATSPFAVPAGYPGYLVVCQSIALENNILGFVISNAALADLQ